MDLKVPITIADELTDEVISATGLLDLASGDIKRVEYQDYDVEARGYPFESDDYEFSSGTLSNDGKDVEFRVDVNVTTGQYSVSPSELLEIKVRAAALFAGMSGKDLLANTPANAEAAPRTKPAAKPAGKTPVKRAAGKAPAGRGGRLH